MTPKEIAWRQVKYHWDVYLFVLPAIALVALFQYFPTASGIFHSFFNWNGADISEYRGLENYRDLLGSPEFWRSFRVVFIIGAWNIFKMLPPLLLAICIHRCRSEKMQYFYRCMFVIPMVLPGIVVVLIWRSFFFESTAGYLNQFLYSTHLFDLLCYLDKLLGWDGMFVAGRMPNWIGDPKLILIACIVWGFPWVGSYAVLIHLAKLQNIGKDIYEAAEIDGVTWWTKFTKIELPLITSSIYLLLVFTIIDTIKDAAAVLALVDIKGGPGGVVAVPALFMLRKAFLDNKMGYACAIGIVLTIIVLTLQKISMVFQNWNELKPWQQLLVRLFCVALGMVLLFSSIFTIFAVVLVVFAFPWSWIQSKLGEAGGNADDVGARQRRWESRRQLWEARRLRDEVWRSTPAYKYYSKITGILLRGGKHAMIWLVLLSALLPVYLMGVVSFKTNKQYYVAPATVTAPLHPEMWNTAWEAVGPSLANTMYLATSTTFLTLSIALFAAYFFARLRLPFSGFLWNALLILMMMPSVANLMPLFRLLTDMNLINTLSALILVGTAGGQAYSIFVIRNFVSDIPQDLFEAAEIDGASHFQQLKTVVFPLSGTILGTVGIRLFIDTWNDFVLPLIVMRDQVRLPVMVQLQRLAGSYIKQFGPLMAGYAIAAIPIIVLFIFSMKLFIKGMTEGAVKG